MMISEKDLKFPTFLMCAPYNLSTDEKNNIWMQEMTQKELEIDIDKAVKQWMNLYGVISTSSLVHLIPTVEGLQDQVYTANLGIHLPHIKDKNVIVVSKFKSPPRRGEQREGISYFGMNNKFVYTPPLFWEGEADTKFIKDNLYIGGYGQRTDREVYDWFEETFPDMKIIRVEMVEEYLYHLDCSVFPLNTNKVLVCTELYEPNEIKQIEKHVEIIDVPVDIAFAGGTNNVRVGSLILSHSNIQELKVSDELYKDERDKVYFLTKIAEDCGLEPMFINLSEFTKSGAMCSCLCMHLNYWDYSFPNQ